MLGNNKGGIPRKTERGGTRNTGSEKEMNWQVAKNEGDEDIRK